MKKEFYLNGLDCANCARKIEDQVRMLPETEEVSFDFMSKKMVCQVQEKDETGIKDLIQAVVDRLEPGVVVYEAKQKIDPETMGNKDIIQILIGGFLFVLSFFFEEGTLLGMSTSLIAYGILGYEVLYRAGRNILKGQWFDENFLMSIATIGALAIGDVREAVAVMLFYQVGESFQERAVFSSRRSISSLMDIRPDIATILKAGKEVVIPAERVQVNDVMIVKPGERIPLDGVIVEGKSRLDTSSLTGESLEREVEEGDEVLSGCVNQGGLLQIKVDRPFTESTVSKILELVENTNAKKARSEQFITRFSKVYTPIVVFLALGLWLFLPMINGDISYYESLRRALTFLVISCPCALVVSIPLGFFAGIGGLSKNGILVKGSTVVEKLAGINQVVLDKTGTITKGEFGVDQIIGNEIVLELAAYAESNSTHPIAKSIVQKYGKEIDKNRINTVEEIAGFGLKVQVDGDSILVGNAKLMKENQINIPEIQEVGTLVYVAKNQAYEGVLVIRDQIKEDSKFAIDSLKKAGVAECVMVTGDNDAVAQLVAQEVGINQVFSECLPTKKVEVVESLLQNGTLAFAGDGINDAPVLTLANVGIAMGGIGSDAAIEAADVVIMDDQLSKISIAIQRSKKTLKIIKQNIFGAIGIKVVVLLLGALGIVNMWLAIFADVGVSVIAILNSIRLLKK